ncbi:hypothetical protein [Nocardiopsis valliformis]|uniref:hypothetical protein n=1 Tax=Nocardiopsis valliformis TaxID=239974 RepID=UPI00034A965F|nr:hypothetical protein [Nocardiopsis valliformis]
MGTRIAQRANPHGPPRSHLESNSEPGGLVDDGLLHHFEGDPLRVHEGVGGSIDTLARCGLGHGIP